jgi:prevent-host-death family protein
MVQAQIRPSRDLRNNYPDVVKTVKEHDYVIITNNGVGELVTISIDDFANYQEYRHERYIYEELQKSKAKLADPNTKLIPQEEAMVFLKKQREARKRV